MVSRLSKRKRPDNIQRNWKHGYATRANPHPIYDVWQGIKRRCSSDKGKDFPNYKGRGITVCERWQIFQNFFDDMALSYKPGLMIERTNNNLGYSPENCIWATRQQQNLNKRNLHLITFNGETLAASEWAKRLGGNTDIVYVRLRRGWTPERAVSTPAGKLGSNGSRTIHRR